MKVIEFNFPPSVAVNYVKQWREQAASDAKADERQKEIIEDIWTLCDLASKYLKPQQPSKES